MFLSSGLRVSEATGLHGVQSAANQVSWLYKLPNCKTNPTYPKKITSTCCYSRPCSFGINFNFALSTTIFEQMLCACIP